MKMGFSGRWLGLLLLVAALGWGLAAQAEQASEAAEVAAEAAAVSPEMFTTNNLWMMIAASLVFIMNMGFGAVEAGLTRSKNSVNILFKNTIVPAIGVLTFALIGFNLMYPGEAWSAGKWLGNLSLGLTPPENGMTADYAEGGYTYYTDFLFQALFCATAATIVSGAVAERIKLNSFMVFTVFFTAIAYPITGSWKWGAGWLDDLGFYDFAGSTLVHSVGGWGALVGVIMLGARSGKYNPDGSSNPIPGHNMAMATLGVFLLWWGWFGFNGGSVLSADPAAVSLVLVTTCIAAAAGAVAAMTTSWIIQKKPDLSMVLNGVLAGLVGITAGADVMSVNEAIIIGAVAGVIVVLSVIFMDQKLRLDDPVGAISVHLVCGVWGTLAVGLLGEKAGLTQLVHQLIGVAAIGLFTVLFCLAAWSILKATMGIRVSQKEELEGLDIGEHGQVAYPDFQPSVLSLQAMPVKAPAPVVIAAPSPAAES